MLRTHLIFLFIAGSYLAYSQDFIRPSHAVGKIVDEINLDGDLSEKSWVEAPLLTNLKTTVPIEGGAPTGITEVRVIAQPKNIYFGFHPYQSSLNRTPPIGTTILN